MRRFLACARFSLSHSDRRKALGQFGRALGGTAVFVGRFPWNEACFGRGTAMPMTTKQCMIQVAGTTYRIEAESARHLVFRLSDDRNVGAFEHRPALRVLESEIAPVHLLEVAKAALRAGRLPWVRADQPRQQTVPERDYAAPTRRRSAARTLASLVVVLWPSA